MGETYRAREWPTRVSSMAMNGLSWGCCRAESRALCQSHLGLAVRGPGGTPEACHRPLADSRLGAERSIACRSTESWRVLRPSRGTRKMLRETRFGVSASLGAAIGAPSGLTIQLRRRRAASEEGWGCCPVRRREACAACSAGAALGEVFEVVPDFGCGLALSVSRAVARRLSVHVCAHEPRVRRPFY